MTFAENPGPETHRTRPYRPGRFALPDDETKTRLVDLNRDGKQDLLVHHPSPAGPHRLITLIAR